jgi:hypothetical protein
VNGAAVVHSTASTGNPPAAAGGAVQSGTYYLVDEIAYPPADAGAPPSRTDQTTIVITMTSATTGTVQRSSLLASSVSVVTSADLVLSGTTWMQTTTCGNVSWLPTQFSVSGDAGADLTLLVDDFGTTVEMDFVRQP